MFPGCELTSDSYSVYITINDLPVGPVGDFMEKVINYIQGRVKNSIDYTNLPCIITLFGLISGGGIHLGIALGGSDYSISMGLNAVIGGEVYNSPTLIRYDSNEGFSSPAGELISNVVNGDWNSKSYKIETNMCFGCGSCVSSCPVPAIHESDGKYFIKSFCIGCGRCKEECPAGAITEKGWL
jgi:Pyruvate/2-oxoacid:ferredoxin oxidoreductase delta subunit